MENWYDDDYEYEPEPEIELPESQSVNVGLSINAGQIDLAIQKHIEEILEPRIKRMVRKKISDSFKTLLSDSTWSNDNMRSYIERAIVNRLEQKYPTIVEDKINEFEESLKSATFKDSRNDFLGSMHSKAKKKVDSYIENELVDSVKRSKDYIEQFSKNYFANNLFKAMGMMDKMLPQTESAAIDG